MVDPPLPNDRLVYWADCERMNLPELERFLRKAESNLTDGTIPDDGSMPRTRQRLKKELGIEFDASLLCPEWAPRGRNRVF